VCWDRVGKSELGKSAGGTAFDRERRLRQCLEVPGGQGFPGRTLAQREDFSVLGMKYLAHRATVLDVRGRSPVQQREPLDAPPLARIAGWELNPPGGTPHLKA
jgi:hypothetical protein